MLRLYKAAPKKEHYHDEFEREVHEAIKIFCCLAWQHSSEEIRGKYPRFSMTRRELRKEMLKYSDKVFNGEGVPEEDIISNVLEPLVKISSVWQGEWADTETADMVLGLASYGACILGGEACRGDLEFEIEMMQGAVKWKKGAIGPSEMLKRYDEGEKGFLYYFLYSMLAHTSALLASVTLAEGERLSLFHGPSAWFWDSTGVPRIDLAVARSEYHLYSSLLHFVEPRMGHA